MLYIGAEDLDDVAVAVSVEIPLGEHQCLNHRDGHYTRYPLCVGDETPLHHQNVVGMKSRELVLGTWFSILNFCKYSVCDFFDVSVD